MPIYEYTCNDCAEDFEKLVYGSAADISCPKCSSQNITKKFSLFGMSGVEKPVTSSGGSACSSCNKPSCSSCH